MDLFGIRPKFRIRDFMLNQRQKVRLFLRSDIVDCFD
jgi:hypothetical protein